MMSLPFLKKNTIESNKFLTATFNSKDVKCALFFYDQGTLKLLGTGSHYLESGSVRAGNIVDIEDVSNALSVAIQKTNDNPQDNLNQIIFGITGDTCLGITTTVRVHRTKTNPISDKEMGEITAKINEASYMQALNENLQITGNSDIDLEIVTSSTVYAKADNILVPRLDGVQAEHIETAVFNAFTPTYHIDNLKKIAKKTDLTIMAIASELYATVQNVKSTDMEHTDFIVLDVGHDLTNAAVVFGEGIVATKSMAIGYRHFIEGLSEKLGLTLMEAEKMLKAYTSSNLTQSEATIVQTYIQEVIEIWLDGLRILFAEFDGVKTFASKIYLSGIGMDIPDLYNAVSNEPWTKSIPFKAVPEFKKLTLADFNNLTTSGTTGSAFEDGVLTNDWLSTLFLGIIYKELVE